MIEAKIILDSIAPSGVRLTTFVVRYPRFIHSELMTHRAFSRNASSSRAIPFEKMTKEIEDDWARPISFRENRKGMQAGDEFDDAKSQQAYSIWESAMRDAVKHARALAALGAHKQYVNRLTEPFAHISVVITATDINNFFALRYHEDAQPEICLLAKEMWNVAKTSTPKQLMAGDWHLPFITKKELDGLYHDPDWGAEFEIEELLKMSVARCARVSYNKHDGTKSTLEEDSILYDRLVASQPIHASPTEHQAMAIGDPGVRSGNFRGWIQHRKTLEGENITKFEGPGAN